ncbi:MAG: hypothetical protein KKB81_05635 [Candidatus Margulisbacteria bacterium]|nr:hypothetical protein [Candidatus Margulisiibacteriota bacterium]MBU1021257.1 hypothetical protein [Candidatus Margulisiibacteriota bacterium]MBU1729254.1 hypothetical protein [Candidatus Margulisiibacteriota bacterium]MBU1954927.1 hypothetical protein [Candidatus Margulisiibacteriota bacterium]
MLFNLIINTSKISPFIAFLVSAFLGIWIYSYNRKSIKNILFALFSFDLAIWALCCYIQSNTKNYGIALLSDQILYSVAAFAPALFIHCISFFTQRERKGIISFSYLLGFIFFIMNWFPIFRSGVALNFGMRFVTIPNIGWYLYLLAYSIIILIAILDLIKAIISKTGKERQQLIHVSLAFIVLLAGGQSYFILIINKFNYLIDSILNLSSSILLALYSIIITLIIIRHRLMDINVVIKKGLVYSTIIAIFTGLYLVAIYLISQLFGNILGVGSLWIAAILIFIFALLFQPLKNKINQIIDKLFFKSSYEYHTALKNISKKVAMATNLEELDNLLSKEVNSILKVNHIKIQKFI